MKIENVKLKIVREEKNFHHRVHREHRGNAKLKIDITELISYLFLCGEKKILVFGVNYAFYL